MRWVEDLMWGIGRIMSTTFQAVGLFGLIAFCWIGMVNLADRILAYAEEGVTDEEDSGD